MKQLTTEQAIALYKSGEWKDWTAEEKVKVQLYQDLHCLPVDEFHGAMEKVLGRPVLNHEYFDVKLLREEYEKTKPAPTFKEIMAMLPVKIHIHTLK